MGRLKIIQYFFQAFWSLVDIIFPPNCAGCGATGTRWCKTCQTSTIKISQPYCRHCGKPSNKTSICHDCQKDPPNYTACRSWGMHEGPLREAVHKSKYYRDLGLGEIMAKNLIDVVIGNQWEVDCVASIPLGKKRLKERGYNQAGLLARPLAWELGVDYKPKSFRRIRETQSQVNLNRGERIENVTGAFWADTKIIRGKQVLMVDDVMTTGATVNAASKAAVEAGAAKVYVVTLARAG